MQICQVITVLGLCLSQTRALAVAPPNDDAIKSFVNLVTQPEASLEKSPMFSDVADALHRKAHTMSHEDFHSKLISTVKPMLEGNEQTAMYITDSFIGYRQTLATPELKSHPAVRAKRLQAYRNSLYSQLKDLAATGSKKFNADSLEEARATLVSLLSKNGEADPSESEALLGKLRHELDHQVTPVAGAELVRLPREEINQQLKSTKLAGVPDAPLIDGTSLERIMASYHEHALHYHQNHAKVPAGMPIAAAA